MKMGKSKIKFYAVACGRIPGIYNKWFDKDGAEIQVKEFPNARYQGFSTIKEAQGWLREFHSSEQNTETANSASKSTGIARPNVERSGNKIIARKELKKGKIIIYTDGGCIENPGPGGYGAILLYGNKRKELSGGFRLTTNNRMELMACIESLKALKSSGSVILFSDSTYVVNGIKKGWAKRWKKKGWMRNAKQPAENADLWKQLLELCDTNRVEFFWIKGHAGNRENERCDRLAGQAAVSKKKLSRDTAYETGRTTAGGQTSLFSRTSPARG